MSVIHPECGVSWNGGSQISAYETAEHLKKYFEVELICGGKIGTISKVLPCIPRGKSADWLSKSKIGRQFSKLFGYPGLVIEAATSFFPFLIYLTKNPPDVVFPNNDYAGLAVAWCLRKLRGTKILYTERAGLLDNGAVLRRNLRFKPDHLVVFNKETVDVVKKLYPEQSVSAITNGVDLKHFTYDGEKFEFNLIGKIVLCVGTLNKNNHKRVELAISAIAKLEGVSLVLCGAGKDEDFFISMGLEMLGSDRFKQISVSFDQMPKLYRSADLFTLPSSNEPFGRVYVEALASGTPVVAPIDEMRRMIVGKAGKLCNVENVDEYAQTISETLNEDLKFAAISQAQKFSWDEIAKEYAKSINHMFEVEQTL